MRVKKTADGQDHSEHQYIRKEKNLISQSDSRKFCE